MKERMSADWPALAADACSDAGIAWKAIEPLTTMEQRFEEGEEFRNNTVLRIDDRLILKLYGPTQQRAYHVERAVLGTIADYGQFPAPRLVAAAQRPDTLPYLFMTALDGEDPDRFWNGFTVDERLELAAELGALTRELHGLPTDDLAAVEANHGGAELEISRQQAERIAEIKASTGFTSWQREQFVHFVTATGHRFFDEPPVLTHADLSHAHIFVARSESVPHVTGFIDWGEAMVGPAAWDIVCHWFWTFSGDRTAMRECLAAYYPDGRPDRLARRCLAALFYTYSMQLLWPEFAERPLKTDDPIREMSARFFPPDVFGPAN